MSGDSKERARRWALMEANSCNVIEPPPDPETGFVHEPIPESDNPEIAEAKRLLEPFTHNEWTPAMQIDFIDAMENPKRELRARVANFFSLGEDEFTLVDA